MPSLEQDVRAPYGAGQGRVRGRGISSPRLVNDTRRLGTISSRREPLLGLKASMPIDAA